MTLSKYTDNLYQSEVYRELERHAVKKGFFKPTETELVKLAAQEVTRTQQINQPVDEVPSDDLIQDVARLAYAMRRKGFVTQAEDLEQKLVFYKTAENALYNVTVETNSDLIGFAHRDGDVNLIEGSGDLGTFETMQSIADKILAVTRKQPTGKQPMNRMAAFASMINKVAQAGGASGSWEEATNTEGILQDFDIARKNAPSLDGLYFSDLRNSNQQNAYVYFARLSGIRVNPQNILSWYRVADVARQEGVLIEGNVPKVSAEKLYNKLNNAIPAWMRLTSPMAALIPAQTKSLRNIANALGVLDIFDSTYLSEYNKSSYIFAGGIEAATNDTNSMAACKWLAQQARAIYVLAFGEQNDTIIKAQTALKSFPETLYQELSDIKIDSKNSTLKQLRSAIENINHSLVKFVKEPTLGYIKSVNADVVTQIISWVTGMQRTLIKQYKGAVPFDLINSVKEAYEAWASKSDANSKAIAEKMKVLTGIIEKYEDRPWVELQKALENPPLKITEPTRESLQQSIKLIIDSARRS